MFQKILVPIDGSELALRAADLAAKFAKKMSAEMVFLHAIVPYIPPYAAEYDVDGRASALFEASASQASDQMLQAAAKVATAHGVTSTSVAHVSSRPEVLIQQTAESLGCDLIVIATHGRGALGRFIMGSVTNRLLTRTSVPVLVYRDQKMVDDFFD